MEYNIKIKLQCLTSNIYNDSNINKVVLSSLRYSCIRCKLMKHGNGKKWWINLNIDHLQGEVLANFPNFGPISKLGPKDQCLASFLGLAWLAGYSNLYLAKIRFILQNFKIWMDSSTHWFWQFYYIMLFSPLQFEDFLVIGTLCFKYLTQALTCKALALAYYDITKNKKYLTSSHWSGMLDTHQQII